MEDLATTVCKCGYNYKLRSKTEQKQREMTTTKVNREDHTCHLDSSLMITHKSYHLYEPESIIISNNIQ